MEIQVVDTGEGISEDGIGRIFDRFYREDWSRNRSTGGSGLGLAITKQLVEAHNGTIQVESIAGDGSTFKVTLPVNILCPLHAYGELSDMTRQTLWKITMVILGVLFVLNLIAQRVT